MPLRVDGSRVGAATVGRDSVQWRGRTWAGAHAGAAAGGAVGVVAVRLPYSVISPIDGGRSQRRDRPSVPFRAARRTCGRLYAELWRGMLCTTAGRSITLLLLMQ
jgi:hypothetical protein